MRTSTEKRQTLAIRAGWLRRLWQGLRQMTGDDAYERYLEHHRRHHDGEPLGRAEYFRRSQREKWDGVRRCC